MSFNSLPRDTTSWSLAGTETFRASSHKLLRTIGGNRQNTPKGMRSIYYADKGKVLIQIDQQGAEALHVAYLARNGNYRALFLNKIKVHSFFAMHAFRKQWEEILGESIEGLCNTPIGKLNDQPRFKELMGIIKSSDDWEPSKRYYFIGKCGCHSSNYDGRAYRLAMSIITKSEGQIKISQKEADRMLNLYHVQLFPEIKLWHIATESYYRQHGCLRNLFGYPWYCYKMLTDDLLRKLYAFVPQSTVGVTTHIAATKMQTYIENVDADWDVLLNGHDSLLMQAPEDEAMACAEELSNFMNMDFTSPRGEKYSMKSECQIGYNWGPKKAKSNPDGLEEVKI